MLSTQSDTDSIYQNLRENVTTSQFYQLNKPANS